MYVLFTVLLNSLVYILITAIPLAILTFIFKKIFGYLGEKRLERKVQERMASMNNQQ